MVARRHPFAGVGISGITSPAAHFPFAGWRDHARGSTQLRLEPKAAAQTSGSFGVLHGASNHLQRGVLQPRSPNPACVTKGHHGGSEGYDVRPPRLSAS